MKTGGNLKNAYDTRLNLKKENIKNITSALMCIPQTDKAGGLYEGKVAYVLYWHFVNCGNFTLEISCKVFLLTKEKSFF